MTNLRSALFAVVVLIATACGSETSRSAESSDALRELPDGFYSCDALNATRSNGPYPLDCDKSGSNITIHFNNGGYVDIDLYSQQSVDGLSWLLEGADAQDGHHREDDGEDDRRPEQQPLEPTSHPE